jgi:hypothetical protein
LIRFVAHLMLGTAVIVGPHVCCCSIPALFPVVPNVPQHEPTCPHCSTKTTHTADHDQSCPTRPTRSDCPLCELAQMTPAWGNVPTVGLEPIEQGNSLPAAVFPIITLAHSFPILEPIHTPNSGPFSHLDGVGIIRALGRLRC